jgi:hypothetical protein
MAIDGPMAILVTGQDGLQNGVLQLKMRRIIGCASGERGGGAQRNAFLNTPRSSLAGG